MAIALDSRQHQQFNMGYDTGMRYSAPHFTNPWVSAAPSSQSQLYATSLPATSVGNESHRYATHSPNVSAAYSGASIPAPSMATDGLQRQYSQAYSSAPAASASTYAPTSAPQYTSVSPPYGYQTDRRPSHPSVASNMAMAGTSDAQSQPQSALIDFSHRLNSASDAERQNFHDALDASRGMVAMSQSDITPRNIYGNSNSSRSSMDSYGFPSTHSSHSSISSASAYPNYYNSSVSEASVGDYSSAGESVDVPNSRTLPRPNGLIGSTLPPAPQSMMGQFSSKVSSSSQKKHKCKICDKRFTRPSSLQTHMYSHTGEKPFACDVDGCGRHFSVVSNLRRHRKVHKGEGRDHPSPDEDDD